MRSLLLSVPMWLGLGVAALAQPQGYAPAYPPQPPPPPGSMQPAPPAMPPYTQAAPPSAMPPSGPPYAMPPSGPAVREPLSGSAANINQNDQAYRRIAPALPTPAVGESGSPVSYLHAAQAALAAGKTGETQEALEMAQTRLLDRSVPMGQTNVPSRNPAVDRISQALQALAAGDRASCMQLIQAAIPAAQASSG